MSRRGALVVSYLMSALAAGSALPGSRRVEEVHRLTNNRRDEPKVSWDSANIRDPLPYGKKARRQLRGGRHG